MNGSLAFLLVLCTECVSFYFFLSFSVFLFIYFGRNFSGRAFSCERFCLAYYHFVYITLSYVVDLTTIYVCHKFPILNDCLLISCRISVELVGFTGRWYLLFQTPNKRENSIPKNTVWKLSFMFGPLSLAWICDLRTFRFLLIAKSITCSLSAFRSKPRILFR